MSLQGKREELAILLPVPTPTPFNVFIGLRNPKPGTHLSRTS